MNLDINTIIADYGAWICLAVAIITVFLRYRDRIAWVQGNRIVFIKLIDEIVWTGVNTPLVMTAWPMVIGEELKGPQPVGFPNIRATTLDSYDIEFSHTTAGQSLTLYLEVVTPDLLRFAPGRNPERALQQLIPLLVAEMVQSLTLEDLKVTQIEGLKKGVLSVVEPLVETWGCRVSNMMLGQYDFVGQSAEAERRRREAAVDRETLENNARAIAAMVQILGRNGYAQVEAAKLLAQAIREAKPSVISIPAFGQSGLPPVTSYGGKRDGAMG